MKTVITDTGTKGFLKWLKSAQPSVYKKIAPKIIAYAKSQTQHAVMSGMLDKIPVRMGSLGDAYSNYSSYASANVGGNVISNPGFSDLNIQPSTSTTADPSAIASSAPMSSDFAKVVGSLAGAYTTVVGTQAQMNATNMLMQTNLLRAQQGLPPLTASVGPGGIITANDPMTPVILIGGAVLLFALMGKKSAT